MSTAFRFVLQRLPHGWWKAFLSDGTQEAVMTASIIPSDPIISLLCAVRLLLLGISEARCSWWQEPGEYRWLFTCQGEQVTIHILWFDQIANLSDEQGETFLSIQCTLLTFAKRFLYQLNQIAYQQKEQIIN